MTPEQSVERLFLEPFEPQWMKRQREAEKLQAEQDLNDMLARIEFNWRQRAKESRERISSKFRWVAKY